MRSELAWAAPRAAAAMVLAMIVVAVGLMLRAVPAAGAGELRLDLIVAAHVSPVGVHGAQVLGAVLEPAGGLVLMLVCAALIWWRQNRWQAARFAAVAAIGWLSVEPVKLLVHRPRPVLPNVHAAAESWSFPSGHVALVTAVVLGLVLVTTGRSRAVTIIFGSAAVIVVALSRLTLAVHYPSDTAASVVWVGAVTVIVMSGMRVVEAANTDRATRPRRAETAGADTQPILIDGVRQD